MSKVVFLGTFDDAVVVENQLPETRGLGRLSDMSMNIFENSDTKNESSLTDG